MTELCSRPCCWLTMAGFFIFVGTIQWTAGLVLLKSKFVFLLSGPNFWTSAANITTGCFLGIGAIVWKKPRRKRLFSRSSRQVARENMVSALLVSSVILNATTATILIMGEGNTILTIRVEGMSEQNSELGEEILRYAYAVSVICPVVCLVVAAMMATERCCSTMTFNDTFSFGTPLKQNMGKTVLVDVSPKQYDWVFDQEQDISGEYLKKNHHAKGLSSPSSSSCDEVTGTLPMERFSPMSNNRIQSTPTVQDLQNSLTRMSVKRTSESPEYSLETNKAPPLAGEVVAIQVHRESDDETNTVPVEQPLTRSSSLNIAGESEVDAAPTRVKTLPPDVSSKLQRNKMSSFRTVHREDPKREHFSPSKNIRRGKSPTMESIVEVPMPEDASTFAVSPSVTSGYGSSPEMIVNASKEEPYTRTAPRQITASEGMETPRKASTATVPKELYGKLSKYFSVNTPQIANAKPGQFSSARNESLPQSKSEKKSSCVEIFDPYSLVGLNNLEITTTQYRNHAILRKVCMKNQDCIESMNLESTLQEKIKELRP